MFYPECGNYAANKAIRKLEESGQIGKTEMKNEFILTRTVVKDISGDDAYGATDSGGEAYHDQFWNVFHENGKGKIFTVIYNGKEYACEGHDHGWPYMGYVALGNSALQIDYIGPGATDTGEPFLILSKMNQGTFKFYWRVEDGETATFSIEQNVEVVVPIDQKYLPEHLGWLDPSIVIKWDGDTTGKETFNNCYKVSDTPYDLSTLTKIEYGNTVVDDWTVVNHGGKYQSIEIYVGNKDEEIVFGVATEFIENGKTITKGVYVATGVTFLQFGGDKTKPIDSRLIPAMDSLTLNGADGKQYKLTVDASGALAVAEVV